ncbi:MULTISPECIES: alpha/beta fold hydrolase [unclassified Isoptericola]|uniref:alpha/beta fold hydrolase n=1 Tax=unclassified Isoptericola TaxID=2623355 RepID=UPI0027126015|nr:MULTISPECIES: alpha/beta hydrolase [unclassified Isoptericola]MDO8143835.1 alpha/beta hydrolase [Isoptericola sp. 178]MDO8147730.1 alpha/beta hydrolase [Isoptericola sp. b515]
MNTTATTVDERRSLPLDDDYAADRQLPVEFATSADGTRIAYERSGSGRPVVIVGGGLNDRAMFRPMAGIMSTRFTVYNYDRRGRGDSDLGDPDAWTLDTEVEDLRAVIEAVGEPCDVFGNCTGGMVAIEGAAAGLDIRRMALYEPPYRSPEATTEQLVAIRRLIDEGRRGEIVEMFGRDIVGFISPDTMEYFKQHPAWDAFESMAYSAYYDAIISRDHTAIPAEKLPAVQVPTVIMRGDIGDGGIHDACVQLADGIPDAHLLTMKGCDHLLDQAAWSRYVMAFLDED